MFLPGKWYLVVTCNHCKVRQPLLGDLSEGKSKMTATYRWKCPQCGHEDSYEGEKLERYQHPESKKANAE
jgi:predicted nucleic-acid-binding Zn-ribbon protein